MAVKNYQLTGVNASLEFGKGGSKFNNNAGAFEAKTSVGAFAVVRGAAPVGDDDFVTKKFLQTRVDMVVSGQIDGASPPAVVNGEIYVVTTTGGTYTVGDLYRGEGGSWVAVTMYDGMTVSIADALTGGTIEFLSDHRYLYDLDTTTWIDIGPSLAEANLVKQGAVDITIADDGVPVTVATVPLNGVVSKVMVSVGTVFSADATLTIGDAGVADRFMANTDLDLNTTGLYEVSVYHKYGASTAVLGTFAKGTAVAGAATIYMIYARP